MASSGGEEQVEGEVLVSLLEASSTPEGRSRLASERNLLPALLSRLRPDLPVLLPFLRLLRNLCAGHPAAQGGGPDAVASVILNGDEVGAPLVSTEVSRVGLQLVGNVAAAGERQQAALWGWFFPVGFLKLARVRDAGTCNALCMALRTCCCSSGEGSRGRLG